ncbi:hypothetical protein B0H11DRAFT_1029894, partial [Mycena galericulata]
VRPKISKFCPARGLPFEALRRCQRAVNHTDLGLAMTTFRFSSTLSTNPSVAFDSNALALSCIKPPDQPRRVEIQRVPHGPGLSLFQATNRLGEVIKPVVSIFSPRPDRWRSRIEELIGNDDAREKVLDELNRNPNCSSRRLKRLEGHCHELLKLVRPEDNSVETQLATFKILVAIITRYPGIRRPFHSHEDLKKASATDPSLSSVWKRPYLACDDEWIFYRNFAAFCISDNTFKHTTLMEAEPPSSLSRVKFETRLGTQGEEEEIWNNVPIETLLGEARPGPEFRLSRLCAIRYLAGILELPSFWGHFPSNTGAKRERKRFLDVLSDLCSTILGLIQDTEGNWVDITVDSSPSMVAGRSAVEILSCSMLNGLLRLRNFNNLPPCVPGALPAIVSMLVRDEGKSFPRAFEPASLVEAMLDSSPFSHPQDENLSSNADNTETTEYASETGHYPAPPPPLLSGIQNTDKTERSLSPASASTEHADGSAQGGADAPPETYLYKVKALYTRTASADDPNQISFVKGEILNIVDKQSNWWEQDWWLAKKSDGTVGIAPSSYLWVTSQNGIPELPGNAGVSGDRLRPETYLYKAKALYAYTASSDDPNEISFARGEILDIVDKKSKWWPAKKSDGTVGIAPFNYLQIIPPNGDPKLPGVSGSRLSPETYLYKAKALYAYTASADDPNQISFARGEILDIVDKQGKWWSAKKSDGTVGIAPFNFLQIISQNRVPELPGGVGVPDGLSRNDSGDGAEEGRVGGVTPDRPG